LAKAIKSQCDEAIKSDRLKPSDAMKLLGNYERALQGYTYLQIGANGGTGPK
jgi:arginine decarboxylase